MFSGRLHSAAGTHSQRCQGHNANAHRSSSRVCAPVSDRLVVRAASGGTPEPTGEQNDKTEELRQKYFNTSGAQENSPSSSGTQPASGTQRSSPPLRRSGSPPLGRPGSPNLTRQDRPPSPTLQRIANAGSASPEPDTSALDNVNPYALGRQARRAFDEVWSQLSNLASPTKSFIIDDTLEPDRDVEFESPQAANTTVLVVGATGRVGRILVRKLLLRGYTVKALVRSSAKSEEYGGALPAAVEVVTGDVGDLDTCQKAVQGVNKVIFCAAARSTFTADLTRVDDEGVKNIAKAMQDEFLRTEMRERLAQTPADDDSPAAKRARRRMYSSKSKKEVADFSQRYHQVRWDVTFVGTPEERQAMKVAAAAAAATGSDQGASLQRPAVDRLMGLGRAAAFITEEDHLVFQGVIDQRGAYAEVGANIHPRLPNGEHRTADTEALTLRVRGDGNVYACAVTTRKGETYIARLPTRTGYLNIRLPYWTFRAERDGQPPLDPEHIAHIGIRYEPRRAPGASTAASRFARPGTQVTGEGRFEIEIDWIKAVPGGIEPDFILVSGARNALTGSLTSLDADRVVTAKRRGEEHLRLSGLGYTIVRPGEIVEEPGGYKTLVFDQGDRIDQPVSAADVADICLRSLHEPGARNKTFDVCYEVPTTDSSMYELVTSAPDKSGTYLRQAAATLVKNT